ncbi:MAG: hypothetical protein EPN85_08960 [Bacteroidetes bacterium]|nr:MAG: hypothetical protein EPN85_08960 [Bacteroidota bacterium]
MVSIFQFAICALLPIAIGTVTVSAQNQSKPVAAVLGIDSKGVIPNSESAGYMVRLELEKANAYNVMDKYDVAEAVKKNNIDVVTCFGKSCVVAAGKILGADKMVTGSVERFGEKIVISLKVIDVKTELVEKQDATEYLNLQPELQKMIAISVQKLMGIATDPNMVNLLINYDAPVASPKTQLRLNGPRMGAVMVFGDVAKVLQEPSADKGGFDMYPVMFDFGWQQEWQYLSAGNFQALVEFIPMISGLESGKFIPSVTFMNGFRMGKGGWEFAFGPSFRIVKKAKGFYDAGDVLGDGQNAWHMENEWNVVDSSIGIPKPVPNPNSSITRLDSRGTSSLSARLIFGIGKTFKSGYLNIPVNLFVIPDKNGSTYGFSFGFNIYKKPRVQ